MQTISDSLQGLALGAPQVHCNLSLFPLTAADGAAPGYLLLDEALERKLAEITEVSTGGSVPELAFENRSAGKILLVDGDELIGAKQNRVLNISIMVAGGVKIPIPVTCVEQGRWSYRSRHFSSGGRALFSRARAKKMAQVSASMRQRGDRRSDQSEVWKDVQAKMDHFDIPSATMSMSDAYEHTVRRLNDYVRAFRAEPGQRGAVVAIDGKVRGMELFDSAVTFAKYLEKLVRAYAMDAIETEGSAVRAAAARDVERFLDEMKTAAADRFKALGEGEDLDAPHPGQSRAGADRLRCEPDPRLDRQGPAQSA